MCDMPRYDLTVSQILSIIGYLQKLRISLEYRNDTVDMVSEIDGLIEALKSIKL